MSLQHIVMLIPLLNSSINGLPSYLLSLAALLNSYMNSSIVFPPCSKSSSMFSFQMSANSPCTYDSTHCICSSTGIPLILICIYSLHAVINPATFLKLPLDFYGLATLTCILGHVNVAALSAPPSSACAIIACSTTSCSCYCQITCSKLILCQLMVYGGGNWLSESTDSMLDSLSDLYSNSDIFLCKG